MESMRPTSVEQAAQMESQRQADITRLSKLNAKNETVYSSVGFTSESEADSNVVKRVVGVVKNNPTTSKAKPPVVLKKESIKLPPINTIKNTTTNPIKNPSEPADSPTDTSQSIELVPFRLITKTNKTKSREVNISDIGKESKAKIIEITPLPGPTSSDDNIPLTTTQYTNGSHTNPASEKPPLIHSNNSTYQQFPTNGRSEIMASVQNMTNITPNQSRTSSVPSISKNNTTLQKTEKRQIT